jgi:hypothetical protein
MGKMENPYDVNIIGCNKFKLLENTSLPDTWEEKIDPTNFSS